MKNIICFKGQLSNLDEGLGGRGSEHSGQQRMEETGRERVKISELEQRK